MKENQEFSQKFQRSLINGKGQDQQILLNYKTNDIVTNFNSVLKNIKKFEVEVLKEVIEEEVDDKPASSQKPSEQVEN